MENPVLLYHTHTITTNYVISNFNHYAGFVYFCIKNNNLKHYEANDYSIFLNQLACSKTCFDFEFLQTLQETLERQMEIVAYIEKKKKKSKVITWRENS